jgi:hypothetical protein
VRGNRGVGWGCGDARRAEEARRSVRSYCWSRLLGGRWKAGMPRACFLVCPAARLRLHPACLPCLPGEGDSRQAAIRKRCRPANEHIARARLGARRLLQPNGAPPSAGPEDRWRLIRTVNRSFHTTG